MPTWSPADDLFTVGDNVQRIVLADDTGQPQALAIRAFSKEVSLREMEQLQLGGMNPIPNHLVSWSLCAADLGAVVPQTNWTITDSRGNLWTIHLARLRTQATRYICYCSV